MNINFHVINALPPEADAFEATEDTDIVDAGMGEGVLFIIHCGAIGASATNTVTVEASSNIVAGAVATVPFVYRTCLTGDTWGAWTASAKTGFAFTTAAANCMAQVYVDSAEIAEEGYRYVRLSTDQTVDNTVVAGILALVINPRYAPMPVSVLD